MSDIRARGFRFLLGRAVIVPHAGHDFLTCRAISPG
jgi:hypothetical protein